MDKSQMKTETEESQIEERDPAPSFEEVVEKGLDVIDDLSPYYKTAGKAVKKRSKSFFNQLIDSVGMAAGLLDEDDSERERIKKLADAKIKDIKDRINPSIETEGTEQ